MAFRRTVRPRTLLTGDELTSAMVGIGMNFAAYPAKDPNIEDTLLSASAEAMDRDDLRVASVLVTWVGAHHSWINADRMYRALVQEESERIQALWSALSRWKAKDRRLKRLEDLYRGPRIDLLPTGTDYLIERRGEDIRFRGSSLRVPADALRSRPQDVATAGELARTHRAYRQRIRMGPTYRADMWAALEDDPTLSVAELARRTYGSFATAWQVRSDWELLKAS